MARIPPRSSPSSSDSEIRCSGNDMRLPALLACVSWIALSAACRSPAGNRDSRTTMTNEATSATPAELVAITARAMTDLPGGKADPPARQDMPGVPDLYSVSVAGPALRLNAFLQIVDGRVTVP